LENHKDLDLEMEVQGELDKTKDKPPTQRTMKIWRKKLKNLRSWEDQPMKESG